jgi:hypothetical protein
VGGGLLLWHEVQVRIRWHVPPRLLTMNRIAMTRAALRDFVKDCGQPPTEQQGLAAMCANPGFDGWKGPYAEPKELSDAWGRELRYRLVDGVMGVWSMGPDGVDGTDDDVHLDDDDVRHLFRRK